MSLRRVVLPALVVYAVAWIPFLIVGDPSRMTSLQFAGSGAKVSELLSGWSSADLVDTALLIGVDFVHPVAYGVLLIAGAVWAGRRLRDSATRWARVVVGAVVAAAMFDVLENFGLIVMIRGRVDDTVAAATRLFSVTKSALIVVAVLYVLAGLVSRARRQPA
ncbi:MAG: hypothetical protein WD826_00275 [Actinomycetota bacterium]